LNDQQKSLFEKVHKKLMSVNTEEPPLLTFVSGAGGVGKSHMIHLLSLLIRNIISEDSLLISALS
jgi:pantothenate kinase-related protein Tda10